MPDFDKEQWEFLLTKHGWGYRHRAPSAGINRMIVKVPQLQGLEQAIRPFLRPGGHQAREAVDAALAKLVNSPDAVWQAYKPILRFARDEMDRLCPRVLENRLPGLLADCSDDLNALATFACINWKSYESHLKADTNLVKTRELLRTDEEESLFNKCSIVSAQPKYDLKVIQSTGATTLQAKSGVCTTFGMTGAFILAPKALGRVRVELVAFRQGGGAGHCFVIVNRGTGELGDDGRIPTPSKQNIEGSWGSSCYVVDPWYATLGHECICLWHEYEAPGFLYRLERTWCSLEDEKPSSEVVPRQEKTSTSCPVCKSGNLKEYSDHKISSGFECLDCHYKDKKSVFSDFGRKSEEIVCPKCKGKGGIVSIDRGRSWKCSNCNNKWTKQ